MGINNNHNFDLTEANVSEFVSCSHRVIHNK